MLCLKNLTYFSLWFSFPGYLENLWILFIRKIASCILLQEVLAQFLWMAGLILLTKSVEMTGALYPVAGQISTHNYLLPNIVFISLTFLKNFDFVLTTSTSYMIKRFSSHKFLKSSTLYCQFKRLWSGKS